MQKKKKHTICGIYNNKLAKYYLSVSIILEDLSNLYIAVPVMKTFHVFLKQWFEKYYYRIILL